MTSADKISVITDENLCAVQERLLGKAADIKRSDKLCSVLVLVPDRFTLAAEKILLSAVQSMLNIRVITFSMLYNLLKEEQGDDDKPILDKTSAVLFMWRAIQAVRGELVWFAHSSDQYAFAEKIFNTVNQLASCRADFANLAKNSHNEITRKKMHDIELIYKKYKELTGEYTDGAGVLGWLIDNVGKSALLKQSHVFITGFENLSVQRECVVSGLMYNAKSFCAGVRAGSEIEGFLDEVRFKM